MLGREIFAILNFIMRLYHVIIFLYLNKVHYYVSRETLLHPNFYFAINALLILTYYNKLCCYTITGNRCKECFDSYFCTGLNNRELHIELLDGIYYNKFFRQVRVIAFSRSDIYYYACCNGHASR